MPDKPTLLTDSTIRGQIMALLEMGDNVGRGEYDLSEVRLSADGALDFLAMQLEKRPQARELRMNDCGLRIGNTPGILRVLDAAPNLEKFAFRKTMLDAQWAPKLLEGIKAHPSIIALDISQNPLDGKGGEALGAFLASTPHLQSIQADACRMGDGGMKAVSKAIGANRGGLVKVSFNHNRMSEKGMLAFAKAATRDNRSLVQISCDNDDAEMNAILEKAVLRAPSPNLLGIEPRTDELAQVIHKNDAAVKHAVMLLQDGVEKQVPRRLQFFEDRKAAIFHSGLLRIGTVPPEKVKQEYEAFMEALPKVPDAKEGLADALFTPDANGFAPLDNPRAWRDKDAFAVLKDVPLSSATLDKTTPKGTSLLDSLTSTQDVPQLLEHLNSRGVKLGLGELQEKPSGRPTRIMETLCERGETVALFRKDNLLGKSRQEVIGMFSLVPEAQRGDIGINAVLSRLPRAFAGQGR